MWSIRSHSQDIHWTVFLLLWESGELEQKPSLMAFPEGLHQLCNGEDSIARKL